MRQICKTEISNNKLLLYVELIICASTLNILYRHDVYRIQFLFSKLVTNAFPVPSEHNELLTVAEHDMWLTEGDVIGVNVLWGHELGHEGGLPHARRTQEYNSELGQFNLSCLFVRRNGTAPATWPIKWWLVSAEMYALSVKFRERSQGLSSFPHSAAT